MSTIDSRTKLENPSIWHVGYWTPHLIRWQHQLYRLFPTQMREIEQLTANQCKQTMLMYQDEYAVFCAVERMTLPQHLREEERRHEHD
jgi:hypothetical protein